MTYMSPRRALAEQEYQDKRRRQARVRRIALAITAGGLSLSAVIAIVADRLLWPDGFPIRDVYLEGEFKHIDPSLLKQQVVSAIDGNFFSVDLARLETAAENLPWVYQATVRRVWPRGVRVAVEEQRLVARWGDAAWLNIDGEVIKLGEIDQSPELPMLSGPNDQAATVLARYREWRSMLSSATEMQLLGLHMSDRRAWRIELIDPKTSVRFEVLLGRRDLAGRLQRFQRFYDRLSLQQKRSLRRVDARYPNGVAVVVDAQPQSDSHASKKGGPV